MKRLIYTLFSILLCTTIACTFETSTVEDEGEEDDFWESLFAKTLEDYSSKFQQIIASEERTFRGINLGMTQEEVRGVEFASQAEIEDNLIRYELNFSLKENVDIEYFFTSENKLKEAVLIFYGASEPARDSLWNEFIEYYDDKLATHQQKQENVFWLSETKDTLLLQKVGTERHPNLMLHVK